jgi:hypothetical protein
MEPHDDKITATTPLPVRATLVRMGRKAATLATLATGALAAQAQTAPPATRSGLIQDYANGVLSLMAYTVAPDVTTSSIAIQDASTANPNLSMTQFGGGFVISDSTRLYLEGNAAYSRYDPRFVLSDGEEQSVVPVKWNTVSATGGIGWDFPLSSKWSLRPIFNFSLGYVASDLQVARSLVEARTDRELDFLDDGRMKAYGLGGSLMAVYEYDKPDREIDFEGRYTNVKLRSYGSTSEAVQGEATSESVILWGRMRVPTGMTAMDRPVRYVFEVAHTTYLDDGAKTLNLEHLTSLGIGLELDSSAHDLWFTRWRAVLRHLLGPNVSGWSLGLAASF